MIYLNNAATSYPKPKEVIEAVSKCIQEMPVNSARSSFEREVEDIDYSCRSKLAKLFNISDPYRIIFTSGSTEALNLAIKGAGLENSHVITTQIEHNSVIRPLMTMKVEGLIELDFAECDNTGYVEPENIERLIKSNTKAIVVNHSSNVTGSILDLKTISEIAHKHNCILIVDASQSAGNIPIDAEGWGIDMLAFTGHKSLYGLQGIGGLYIREGLYPKPLKVGGTGVLSEVLLQPEGMPLYYEAGTPNTPGIVSLDAGIDFIFKTGMDNIHRHKARLVKKAIDFFKDNEFVKIYTSEKNNSLANFCFTIENMVPEEVGYMLESSFDITVRTGLHCAPLILEPLGVHPWGTVRASPSFFTTDEEMDKFIHAVAEIAEFAQKHKNNGI